MMMHKINYEQDYGIPCRKARNVIHMFNIIISIYCDAYALKIALRTPSLNKDKQ